MRALLVLLLAGSVAAQTLDDQDCGRGRCLRARGRSLAGQSLAMFEFAPASGAGMGTVCGACSNPVASPQDVDLAPWTSQNGIIGAPTVTANAATAPDGTLTAERVQFPAAGATGSAVSQRFQTLVIPVAAGTGTCQVWIKGNGTSGTMSFRSNDGSTQCTGCAYNSSTWSNCSHTHSFDGTATGLAIGSYSTVTYPCTGSDGLAVDVFVWGFKCESGNGTPYVPTPTGARGEAMTFTRASTATCLTGNTNAINNGELITCRETQPRVMPGGDGTGGRGLLVESARTNYCLRSEEFENAAWNVSPVGVAAPTITANAATSPDGLVTADRFQIPATSAGQQSLLYQVANSGAAVPHTASWFLKGNASSGTTELCIYTGGGQVCAACPFVAASWTRCTVTATTTGATARIQIGNQTLNSGVPRSAVDFFAYGAMMEAGTGATSYVKTTTAASTRAVESSTFPTANIAGLASTGSAAATFIPITNGSEDIGWWLVDLSTTARLLFQYTTGANIVVYDGTTLTVQAAAGYAANTPGRYSSNWAGSTMFVRSSSASASGAFDGTMTATTLTLGNNALGVTNGVLKQICLDPNPVRCR